MYCILCRAPSSASGHMKMVVSGMKWGTGSFDELLLLGEGKKSGDNNTDFLRLAWAACVKGDLQKDVGNGR